MLYPGHSFNLTLSYHVVDKFVSSDAGDNLNTCLTQGMIDYCLVCIATATCNYYA